MNKHFIAMAGLHGCLPQCLEVHDTLEGAVESMAALHELGKTRRSELKKQCGIELNLKRDGNEYIEIEECFCDNPDQHEG